MVAWDNVGKQEALPQGFSLSECTDLRIDIHAIVSDGNAGKYKDVDVPRFRVNK